MKRKRHTPTQIISKLREAEEALAKGTSLAQICKQLTISEHTYYRWQQQYGKLTEDDAKRICFVRDDGSGFDMAYADGLFGASRGFTTQANLKVRDLGGHGASDQQPPRVADLGRECPDQGATFYFSLLLGYRHPG